MKDYAGKRYLEPRDNTVRDWMITIALCVAWAIALLLPMILGGCANTPKAREWNFIPSCNVVSLSLTKWDATHDYQCEVK